MTHTEAEIIWGAVIVLAPVWFPFVIVALMVATLWMQSNTCTKLVGGLRFVKIGRFCFSYCVTKTYKPFN